MAFAGGVSPRTNWRSASTPFKRPDATSSSHAKLHRPATVVARTFMTVNRAAEAWPQHNPRLKQLSPNGWGEGATAPIPTQNNAWRPSGSRLNTSKLGVRGRHIPARESHAAKRAAQAGHNPSAYWKALSHSGILLPTGASKSFGAKMAPKSRTSAVGLKRACLPLSAGGAPKRGRTQRTRFQTAHQPRAQLHDRR